MSDTDGSAMVGHHDRTGGGANPTSWNSAREGAARQICKALAGTACFPVSPTSDSISTDATKSYSLSGISSLENDS